MVLFIKHIHYLAPGPHRQRVIRESAPPYLIDNIDFAGQEEAGLRRVQKFVSEAAPTVAICGFVIETVICDKTFHRKKGKGILQILGEAESDSPRMVASGAAIIKHGETVGATPGIETPSMGFPFIPIVEIPSHAHPTVGPGSPAPRAGARTEIRVAVIPMGNAHLIGVTAD